MGLGSWVPCLACNDTGARHVATSTLCSRTATALSRMSLKPAERNQASRAGESGRSTHSALHFFPSRLGLPYLDQLEGALAVLQVMAH